MIYHSQKWWFPIATLNNQKAISMVYSSYYAQDKPTNISRGHYPVLYHHHALAIVNQIDHYDHYPW